MTITPYGSPLSALFSPRVGKRKGYSTSLDRATDKQRIKRRKRAAQANYNRWRNRPAYKRTNRRRAA